MTTHSLSEEARGQIDMSMMAWRVHEFGPPETMQFERVPVPNPGPGEVLVNVHAAGVGPWDGWIRSGRSALPQPLPLTLGSDLSGDILAVGPEIYDFDIGEQVYGVTNPRFIGAYAEYALASAAMIARKPTSLTYIEAASVPVIGKDCSINLNSEPAKRCSSMERPAMSEHMRCNSPAAPASGPSQR
jgi:NADPH-dependent curcumin reductase CurA